ncbi:hypothetical protein K0B96_12220 [Horticoccus luteus]|uniref:Tetratricopeptide repeat protein n=1 Tax=Horticoccus luteus TaxID=2862869 RepID=A0A8F9TU04_9BACT|nr:tetratricopeptide repeat protein [Horticoccus luteus]QYM78072.1 hypothetical protein K0B96_12220 [Horticoccus luteus]
MKRLLFVVLALALLGETGCKPKREPTSLERKKAESLLTEANFAETMRDWPRAEKLYAEAGKLTPGDGDLWLQLGTIRRRQDDRNGAKKAYANGLDAYRAAYKKDGKNPTPLIQQVYALALLGRVDEARKTLAQARLKHADNAAVRNFTDAKFDQWLASADFKAAAL